MYTPGPDLKELEAIGLTLDDVSDQSVTDIWPENALAFDVFCRCRSQWFIGPGGPTGLRYESLPFIFKMAGVPKKKYKDLFQAVQVMESEALRIMINRNKD